MADHGQLIDHEADLLITQAMVGGGGIERVLPGEERCVGIGDKRFLCHDQLTSNGLMLRGDQSKASAATDRYPVARSSLKIPKF